MLRMSAGIKNGRAHKEYERVTTERGRIAVAFLEAASRRASESPASNERKIHIAGHTIAYFVMLVTEAILTSGNGDELAPEAAS
jgi:hypothetical protein